MKLLNNLEVNKDAYCYKDMQLLKIDLEARIKVKYYLPIV